MTLKEKVHTLWNIRHEYYEKVSKVVQEVYNELGGFVSGTDMHGNIMYFMLVYDRVKFTFKRDGYFDIYPEALELDCYGELHRVDYEEFREAFDSMSDIKQHAYMDDKLGINTIKSIDVAKHLISDERFKQLNEK